MECEGDRDGKQPLDNYRNQNNNRTLIITPIGKFWDKTIGFVYMIYKTIFFNFGMLKYIET